LATTQDRFALAPTNRRRSHRHPEVVKRSIDVFIASVGLIVALPLLLLLAVAIRLDSPGPVFFRQVRVGRFGEPFRILKFRTMYHQADEEVHKRHLKRLSDPSNARSLPIRLDNDQRITRMGKILRKWSLDELPNLWNVVKGEMSMVGPRPLVPYEVAALDEASRGRLEVKPGVTGLAQVNGRLDCSLEERADYDAEYAARCSIARDLSILVMTVPALLRRRGI